MLRVAGTWARRLAHQPKELDMTSGKSVRKVAVVGALALAGLGWGATASAQNVFWSVGVASPGVQVAVSNAPQVVYQHQYPVVVQPQPVYVQPHRVVQPVPVYSAYPVYGGPVYRHPGYGHSGYGRPVFVQQAPVVVTGWHGSHRGWHRGWDNDNHGRGGSNRHGGQGGIQQPAPQPVPQHGHGGGHR
jgi:hypothetical protein